MSPFCSNCSVWSGPNGGRQADPPAATTRLREVSAPPSSITPSLPIMPSHQMGRCAGQCNFSLQKYLRIPRKSTNKTMAPQVVTSSRSRSFKAHGAQSKLARTVQVPRRFLCEYLPAKLQRRNGHLPGCALLAVVRIPVRDSLYQRCKLTELV